MMWYNENKNNIPSEILELVAYALNKIKENNLDVELIDRGYILSKKINT